ncbi:hypothetical protein K5F93_31045 [Pseudomonas protegens]|uniref:hypothetical protein n=1 Tax=Pseudomonas protegens TaxID=380021 RepID=UPI001C8E4279|nr:hypothetical protein [Pseudomonas protegens]QZI70708.1 hypothetical protein K5F93_31045 [Pseudomonas protegens]
MGNMLRKGQVALVRMFSGDDPLRLFSLMLAAYLGISASALPSLTNARYQAPSVDGYQPTTVLPISRESTLTLDAEPVIGRISLPSAQQQPAPRWVF